MPLTPSISNPSVAKFGIPSTSLAVVFDTRLEESTILSIYINNTWAGPLISITIDDQFLDIKSGEKFYTSIEYEFKTILRIWRKKCVPYHYNHHHLWHFLKILCISDCNWRHT
ncbi:hypothetical protein P8452_49777 [Trifolium repens]|nr:hypothetical protein P8452_49777 [Trifolium repens]